MSPLLPGMQGEARSVALSQWYTPPALAERVVRWALTSARLGHDYILEPAAGRGALIKPLYGSYVFDDGEGRPGLVDTKHWVEAWDIDAENVAALEKLAEGTRLSVNHGDFLEAKLDTPMPGYTWPGDHLCLMNPPYEGNQDIAFVEKALTVCDGVVGIFQSRIVHSQGRAPFWRMHDITRMAILSERPHFGGEHSAKTDFVVLEITRRKHARKQGEATPAQVEWW